MTATIADSGQLEKDGFAIVPDVFTTDEVDGMISVLSEIEASDGVRSRKGVYAVRNLLELSPAIRALAQSSKVVSLAPAEPGRRCFPVRATLFDKTDGANWLVPWHQDLTICVAARREVDGFGPWSVKAGVCHVQPPVSVLEGMVSGRIHLDDCPESNGALRVLPGTHKLGRLNAPAIAELQRDVSSVCCEVGRGGVVLMRPLLLHSSSPRTSGAVHRRVIHIDYACADLSGGLCWLPRDATDHRPGQ